MTIKNDTPDYYSYCFRYHPETEGIVKHGYLAPYERHKNKQRQILTTVYVRYGKDSAHNCRYSPMLQRYYNGIHNHNFFIRPVGDMVKLYSNKGGSVSWCANYGERMRRQQRQVEERRRQEEQRRQEREEENRRRERERQIQEQLERERQRQREEAERRRREEERRRREEEERRRRERIERERRIQEQITKEAAALENKLGRAAEKRRLNTSLTGREQQHQRVNVLAQTVEDDAEGIVYEEEKIITAKFQELLKAYSISIQGPPNSLPIASIGEQIKILYDQLISRYCSEVDLNIWFHTSFDEATQFNTCSLTDKLEIVEALAQVILDGENSSLIDEIKRDVELHEKHSLLIRLMAVLKDTDRSLSTNLLGSCLNAFAELSQVNKNFIEMIVYNNIWTPLEAVILLMRTVDIPQDDLALFLHTVQTYRVNISEATAAIKSNDRMKTILDFIGEEEDKSLETVIGEMKQNGVPDSILQRVHQIVECVDSTSRSCEDLDISGEVEQGIQHLKEIDFNNVNVEQFCKILTGLCIAVKQEKGYFPRVTQLVSVVTILLSKTPELTGCLLEISTGEGKSCIVAMLAVILALRGSSVDVITSSPMLAIRDVEEWSDYFAKFNLTARSACPIGLSDCKNQDEMDALVASSYQANIVYGTVGNLAADTLKQEFEKKTIRGNRGFEAVIVDEVDYMTLDNGVQVTFLSHATSGMRHVEQVLASVWNMVCGCRPIDDAESGHMFWCTGVQHVHKAIISALVGSETNEHFNEWELLQTACCLGMIKKDAFKNLTLYETQLINGTADESTKEHKQTLTEKMMNQIGVPEARDLLTVLEAAVDGVAFECYTAESGRTELFGPKGTKSEKIRMLLMDNGLACELLTEAELVEVVKTSVNDKLKYSQETKMPTKEDKKSDGVIYVPQVLKAYVENRMTVFIKNALKAILMSKGREYTIDRAPIADGTDSPPHHFDSIIPVDFKASGVLEKNKRWGDGLQQFLEMKHQLALTPLSTVTNYLSNFHFFKRYTNGSGIYGVSGTLGDESACTFLEKHFKVSTYPIPTHKHKKLIEIPMIQVEKGEQAWMNSICQKIKAAISAKPWCKGQAALVVCEDLKTANKTQEALTEGVCKPEKVTMYTRSDKHTVEDMDFGPGHVIIATNLGGRGTDFSVTDEVIESGGLFVLLTHFPSNRRVEKQIFGRTARKGQPGVAQMVLNYHSLAQAYQGQSIDMMRQLREDYERQRIIDMETDELLTIDIREKLFRVFCEKLSEVTALYKGLEAKDWGQVEVCEVPSVLEKLLATKKIDCKPAQNAFKEAWAYWLILNEHRIEDNEDVNQLTNDLESVLNQLKTDLEQGISANFYDHTRQALGRMYLHEADHSKDCGTLTSWDKAIDADPAYKAIALYNKAYIVINMGKDGYIDEAINLLKETIPCVDVHVAENANTLMACHISTANGQFEAHNSGETNFKRQLEIRNSFFKMWLDYTDKAIKKLEELKKAGEDAITEEKGIFALIEKPSHLEASELQELFNEGLQVVYEVKKKPRFCISALICAIIGVLQVLAGALVCGLSFGSASQIGLGLISEGVSDVIAGVEGMIKGTFDWAEWAISKAISVGLSLLTAGFSKIKDAACAVAKGVKALLTGAKSLSSVADDCMRAAKSAWTSAKTAFSSATRESLKQSVVTLSASEVAKANFKQAGKYVFQEVIEQGVMKGLDVGISKGTEALFEKLLAERFNAEVERGLHDSTDMQDCLTRLTVCYGVPATTLQAEIPEAFQIPSSNETIIHRQIKDICERVVPQLTTNNALVNEIFARLKEVKDEMEGILGAMDASGKLFTAATVATEIGLHTTKFVTMIQNIPTQKVMQENVVPEFKEDIDMLLHKGDAPKYKNDARSEFPTVQNMKQKLLKTLTEKIAAAFTDACASNLNSFLTDFARSKLNERIKLAMHKTTGRFETNYYFQKKQEQYHMEKQKSSLEAVDTSPVSEHELNDLTSRVRKIEEADNAPSIVELKAMIESGQLGGKGLEIQTVDRDGTELFSVAFKGSDSDQGKIKLRVVREDVQSEGEKGFFTKLKETVQGKDSPWSGHFDLVSEDGSTVIKLDTGEDNSLFYAITLATHPGLSPDEVKEKASSMRAEVADEILRNPENYIVLHRRQKEYEAAYGDATFFSLPPKQASRSELRRADATVRVNSFSLTRMKLSLEEKASEMWSKLETGDRVFLKSTLKFTATAIRKIATPIGNGTGTIKEESDDSQNFPILPGSAPPKKSKLLYIPSKDIVKECSGQLNTTYAGMSDIWSQDNFVSMVIPWECDHQIIASVSGKTYGIDEKPKLYEIYKTLLTDCLCGLGAECTSERLLKLSMICSHPDSTLDILFSTGLLKKDSAEYLEAERVELEGLTEGEEIPEGQEFQEGEEIPEDQEIPKGEEIPEDQDPRMGKTLYLDPSTGGRMDGPWGLSDECLDAYFKICYFVVLTKYKTAHCLDESTYEQLVAWVDGNGFLDKTGQEYVDIVNAVNAIK